MKLKQTLLLIITAFAILLSANSHAGRQGINFYYGLGLGLMVPGDVNSTVTGLAATANGEVIFGIEEDGWAIEGIAFNGFEAGSDIKNRDYTPSGSNVGLVYRTIEKKGTFFKYKISSTKMDFDYSDSTKSSSTSGNTYSFGYGWRMARDERMEVEYSFYKSGNSTELKDPVHMLTAKYFWGGAPYEGQFADWESDNDDTASPFYAGLMLGQFDPDLGSGFDSAATYGLLFGYDLSQLVYPGISVEFLAGTSSAADSAITTPDEYTSSYFALYGVYRSEGKLYVKARLGYMNLEIEDDQFDATGSNTFAAATPPTVTTSESGLSYGLGAGYKMNKHIRFELEYTAAMLETSSVSYDPNIIGLSALYSF